MELMELPPTSYFWVAESIISKTLFPTSDCGGSVVASGGGFMVVVAAAAVVAKLGVAVVIGEPNIFAFFLFPNFQQNNFLSLLQNALC